MESKKVRVGSVSLLFTVIMICVVVLSILSISTVRADWSLSQRTAESVSSWYDLQNEGQRWLSQLDGVLRKHPWKDCDAFLPEGARRKGNAIETVLEQDNRSLHIEVRQANLKKEGVRFHVVRWREVVDWEDDQTMKLFQ